MSQKMDQFYVLDLINSINLMKVALLEHHEFHSGDDDDSWYYESGAKTSTNAAMIASDRALKILNEHL